MIFKSQSNMVLNYVLIIGMILLFVIAIIIFTRRKKIKKLMVPVCAALVVLIAAWIFNSYHYGIKKIVLPLIQGDNEYTTRTEMEGYLKWLNGLKLKKVEYDMEHDPTLLSGGNSCADIVYYNGDMESYIYNGVDYLLVINGRKGEEKQLYQVIE